MDSIRAKYLLIRAVSGEFLVKKIELRRLYKHDYERNWF